MPAQGQPQQHTLVIVSHTHWDREWYEPFEAMRARLVVTLDRLLPFLDETPDFPCFVLDGHTLCLEDYLEVRPERREDVARLVRQGRLVIGPNYVLPDEFLIGLESWVRNLMLGLRTARAFGSPMPVGYSPDAFGHMAHLPAILRGFGLEAVVIWRGVGEEADSNEFRWASPDGSEVLAIYLRHGYSLGRDLPGEPQALALRLRSVLDQLLPHAPTPYLLLPSGDDHRPPQEDLPRLVALANRLLPEVRVVQADYAAYVRWVRQALDGRLDALPRLEGEFRSGQRSNVLSGVLSARIWIKQRYQQCEDLLARWAAPFSTWAHLLRAFNGGLPHRPADHALLEHAWRLLLQNAPHDSICGCSVDQVHEEMRPRFDRCQQLGEVVLREALGVLAGCAVPAQGGTYAVVFNSEGGPRDDFCTLSLPLEGGRAPQALEGPQGERVPLQLLSLEGERGRALVGFVAPQVLGHGLKAFRVLYGQDAPPPAPPAQGNAIENEFFRVEADPTDGSLTVHDKNTGRVLRGLNRFVDGGDAGDQYNYAPPRDDRTVAAPCRPPSLQVLEAGPARWTLEVQLAYELPASLTADGQARSPQTVECPIASRVHLYSGVPRIDIETEVENRAQDHRLRVHFPSGLRADHVWAEQHLGAIPRPVELPPHRPTDCELPTGTQPQKSFCAVEAEGQGLLLANRGLPEYEALQEADGSVTLALTLLRCVGWLSRPDLSPWRRGPAGPPLPTPGAQMPGRWTFHYSLVPYGGTWEEAMVHAHRFARPLQALRPRYGNGLLAPSTALVEVEPPQLVISTVKLAEDGQGVVVRVYNAALRPLRGRLRLFAANGPVQEVDLEESPLATLATRDGWLPLEMRPHQLRTFLFRFP
jgi:mannosylglycerate hydrolase